jgi:amidase
MKRVPRDRYTFVFAANVAPVLEVEPGEEVTFETLDSWAGRLQRPDDIHVLKPDLTRANPAAGPVLVRGAEPGDALVAEIQAITPHSPAISKITGSGGVLSGAIGAPHCRFLSLENGFICFWRNVRIPLRPMIGCIATAPAVGQLSTADPGDHGGNMDHNDIRAGSRLYLPVGVPGALFGLGDVHASMGDAEVSGAGLDCNADVRVRLDLVKHGALRRPLIETADAWMTCASASSLQAAVRLATQDMVEFLARRLCVSREDAFLLATAAGDVKVGQACASTLDSTARMSFPKIAGLEGPLTTRIARGPQ